MNNKILKNALIGERQERLTNEERQEVVIKLLETHTLQSLADEIGVSKTTIFDWKTLRQSEKSKRSSVSFNLFYNKIIGLSPGDVTDWGRLKKIQERIKYLLENQNI
jgi:hypothetical protein